MKKYISIFIIVVLTQLTYSQEFSVPQDLNSAIFTNDKSNEKSFKITHSLSQTIIPGTSVSCNSNGIHYDNSYYRVFDLKEEFKLNGDWLVQSIEFGIGQAVSGTGNSQPVNIIFYVMSEYDNIIVLDSLTQKGDTLKFEVFNNESGTLKNLEVTPNVKVNFGQVLVVEVFVPSGNDHSFFIGSNDLGETDSTYILAEHCGVNAPVPMSSILYPDMHLVMNLYGVYENPIPEILLFEISGQINFTEIINDPDWEINVVMPVDALLDALAPNISVPAGFQVIPASGELVDFSGGAVIYEVNNEIGKVSQTWDVYVNNAGPDILAVLLTQQNGETVIDSENHTVTIPVPFGTNLTSLSPVITIYVEEGFIIDPPSGSNQDFSTGPVTYTVSHETLPLSQDWEINIIESGGSSINHSVQKSLIIYPNPANDIIQISVRNIEKIEIFNIKGNIVLIDKSPEHVSISNLSEGIYFIRIYSEDKIFTEKLIIIK